MMNKIAENHYINGKWYPGKGASFHSINPTDGNIIWNGTEATSDEIKQTFLSSQQALTKWHQLSLEKRIHYLKKFAEQVQKNKSTLMYQISLETGKPLWESLTEVNSVINKVDLSIKAYVERCASKESQEIESNSTLRYKPHGVIVVLGPFNFPAHLSNGHIVPALLAGNTVIYKPSELTPMVANLMMQCFHEAKFPPGVVQCLHGGATVAKQLVDLDVQGVFFTGSYHTGVQINQQMSHRPEVLLALEMGGNNPLLIDKVKNIQAAVYITLLSTMITAGQRCTCARRVFIPDNTLGEHFLKKYIRACQTISIDSFTVKPEPFMGPTIRYKHALSHLEKQEKLIAHGGNALIKMALLKPNTGFLSPGIIDMTETKYQEDDEIFAPLVQLYRYKTFDEALHLANQTRYGLAAGLISENEKNYKAFYSTIRAGLINWNRPTTGASSALPFGGVGKSGNHRPSAYFAADYCAYPIASQEQPHLLIPKTILPGVKVG